MNTQKPDPGKAAGSEKTELGKGLEMLLEAMTSKIKAHNEQLTNDKVTITSGVGLLYGTSRLPNCLQTDRAGGRMGWRPCRNVCRTTWPRA